MLDMSESLTAESRLVHASPNYRLIKSRSESDLSQPESDEEGYALVGIPRFSKGFLYKYIRLWLE